MTDNYKDLENPQVLLNLTTMALDHILSAAALGLCYAFELALEEHYQTTDQPAFIAGAFDGYITPMLNEYKPEYALGFWWLEEDRQSRIDVLEDLISKLQKQ